MARAGGYVLHLDDQRRNVFRQMFEEGGTFSQPVLDFAHTRTAPLVCFVILDELHISHIAKGRRGIVAGTGLRRLNVQEAYQLRTPIPLSSVAEALDSRTRTRATSVLAQGGHFSPKAFESAVEAVSLVSDEARELLRRFSRQRRELITHLSTGSRRVLGEQKEAVLVAMAIAGLDRRQIHDWSPPTEGSPSSFLDGLPSAVMREDAMIVNDLANVPGFNLVRQLPYTGAIFEGKGKRLTVVLANRLPLEQLTGTDLIYFNESHQSFVMVQYKAMEDEDGQATFRLPNAQLADEIARMQAIEGQIQRVSVAPSKENFRLSPSPFYIKLCHRVQFNPDDIKLFPGMYFALDHWLCMQMDPALVGARGGRKITYKNAGRHIENDFFIRLVAGAWIGTHAEQSTTLETAIRETLQAGKAVALAVESAPPAEVAAERAHGPLGED